MKTSRSRRDQKTKDSISCRKNLKISGTTTDRGLKNNSDSSRIELELTTAKRSNQEEVSALAGGGDRAANLLLITAWTPMPGRELRLRRSIAPAGCRQSGTSATGRAPEAATVSSPTGRSSPNDPSFNRGTSTARMANRSSKVRRRWGAGRRRRHQRRGASGESSTARS